MNKVSLLSVTCILGLRGKKGHSHRYVTRDKIMSSLHWKRLKIGMQKSTLAHKTTCKEFLRKDGGREEALHMVSNLIEHDHIESKNMLIQGIITKHMASPYAHQILKSVGYSVTLHDNNKS